MFSSSSQLPLWRRGGKARSLDLCAESPSPILPSSPNLHLCLWFVLSVRLLNRWEGHGYIASPPPGEAWCLFKRSLFLPHSISFSYICICVFLSLSATPLVVTCPAPSPRSPDIKQAEEQLLSVCLHGASAYFDNNRHPPRPSSNKRTITCQIRKVQCRALC